jgi:salicylate hydroxylase
LSENVKIEELLEAYPAPDYSQDVRDLLRCIANPVKWYVNIVYPHLKTYAKGRVALLGDAVGLRCPLSRFSG